jgi:hypothetical protein
MANTSEGNSITKKVRQKLKSPKSIDKKCANFNLSQEALVTIKIVPRTFPRLFAPFPARRSFRALDCVEDGDGPRAAMDAEYRPQQVWQDNAKGLEGAVE